LCFDDGLRPDGITIPPWANGKSLVWDITVTCSAAESYINNTSDKAGWAAERAAKEKCRKYAGLLQRFLFLPLAFETLGPICKEGLCFINLDLGRRLENVTGESREGDMLRQRLSVAIWRGNGLSIMESMSA